VTVLLVAVGAALGAPARYLADRAVQRRWPSRFPWGTLLVNLLGSLLAGGVLAASRTTALPPEVVVGLTVGFCGALTTCSTFSGRRSGCSRTVSAGLPR
jgi:CrcB protein